MSDEKTGYGSDAQTITITIASLANAAARESTVVDNTSNKFEDALVGIKIKSGGSGTASTGQVYVYAYGTADTGTPTYMDNVTGSDAAITLTVPPNLRLIGILNVVANSTTYKGLFPVARAFDGILPEKWGIVIQNNCGGTLDATGSNHAAFYQGIYRTAS